MTMLSEGTLHNHGTLYAGRGCWERDAEDIRESRRGSLLRVVILLTHDVLE